MSISRFYNAAKIFGFKGFVQICLNRFLLRILNQLDRHTIRSYEIVYGLLQQGTNIIAKSDHIELMSTLNGRTYQFVLLKIGSDLQVYKQLILNEEYAPAIEIIKQYGIVPSTMLDAGANIGLATIYFKAFFPELQILAVEPSFYIYQRLRNHIGLNQLNDISTVNAAVWLFNTKLRIDKSFRDGLDWATRTVVSNGGDEQVDALDIPSLLVQRNFQTLDILKMDIEGAESEIFRDSESVESWLPKVRCLILEIHDEFNCRQRIVDILKAKNFRLFDSHEYTIAINLNIIEQE